MTAVAMKAVAGTKPSFEPEKPPPLFEAHLTQSAAFFQYDVTADGERFLLATTAGTAYPPLLNVVINWKWDWRDDWRTHRALSRHRQAGRRRHGRGASGY